MNLTEFWPNPIADGHAERSICCAIGVEGGERSLAASARRQISLIKAA